MSPGWREAASRSPRPSTWGTLLAPLLIASACVFAVATPVLREPTGTFLCTPGHPDCLGNHWLLVWVSEQLRAGGTLLHNDRYYWPVGDAPWLAGNGGEGIPFAPFGWVLGWPLGANVYLLCVLVANGLAAWWLARTVGAGRAAALPAAASGATLVYAVHELGAGRFTQANVAVLCAFLAAWVRLLDQPTRGRALLSGALLAAASVLYWYHGVFAALAGGAMLLARLLWAPDASRAPLVRPLLWFLAAFTLLAAPPLLVFLQGWSEIPGTAELARFPHPEANADSAWPQVPFLARGGRHAGQALALSTCLLALVGLAHGWHAPDRWKVRGALLGMLLALLLTAGTKLPLFEAVYGIAPPLRRFWWPSRHAALTSLLAVAIASRGLEPVLAAMRRRAPRHARLAAGGLALAISVAVPLQLSAQGATWRARFGRVRWPEPFYEQLRSVPGEILVQLPLAPSVAGSQAPLMYQLLHGKVMLTGHAPWVERVRPPAWDAFVRENTFLVAVQQLERARLTDGVFRFREEDLERLRTRGVDLWVVDPQCFPTELAPLLRAYASVFTQLFGPPLAQSGTARAWSSANWDGHTTEVRFPAWTWPNGLGRVAPGLPLGGRRPAGTFAEGDTPVR
jgi:hypothetical protein